MFSIMWAIFDAKGFKPLIPGYGERDMKLVRQVRTLYAFLEAHPRHIADEEERDEALIAPENASSC